tara:strand:+ start:1856 stop:2461 length:606 start_codon:yes stop_codon:yes gene_type:complete
MTFEKLADRALLYVDASKGALKELLKEAEFELTREVDIVEKSESLAISTGVVTLPTGFKSVILITHKGDKLVPINESDISYESDGTKSTGDPRGYFIRNQELHFDTIPTGTVNLSYYRTADQDDITIELFGETTTTPYIDGYPRQIPEQYHTDLCYYAVAIAGAKVEGIMEKYWPLWLNAIEKIKSQDADRELIHSIRREV